MVKRSAIAVVLFLLPGLAKADTYVSVVMNPQVFQVNGGETVSATFVWDTTTDTISQAMLMATGTFWQGTNNATVVRFGGGGNMAGTLFLGNLNITNLAGDVLQLNYLDHENSVNPEVIGTPGTYLTDLFFTCPQCGMNGIGSVDPSEIGTATVTPVGDPGSVPEPGSASLILSGSALAILLLRLRN